MSDIEFVNGLIVKAPKSGAPEFVKLAISIKREELIAWLSERSDEWINLQVKESRNGKWYAAVDTWKPEPKGERQESRPHKATGGAKGQTEMDDDIPFAPHNRRCHY